MFLLCLDVSEPLVLIKMYRNLPPDLKEIDTLIVSLLPFSLKLRWGFRLIQGYSLKCTERYCINFLE